MTLVEEVTANIDRMIKNNEALKDINNELRKVSSTSRLNIMHNLKNRKDMRQILGEVKMDKNRIKEYQMWQALWQEAVELDRHDNTVAKMKDVDRATMNAYTILVKMIGALNNALIEQGDAINRIEEKLGMEVTDFTPKEGDSNDVQRNKDSDGGSSEAGGQ